MSRSSLYPYLFCLFAILLVHVNLYAQKRTLRVAFGSCSRQQSEAQLWNEVVQAHPEAWLWLGDNIYGDTHNMDTLRSMYLRQKSRPSYQNLLRLVPVVYGTWDDHDYGVNDGGKFFSKRRESQQLMLDFLDVPAESPVRKRDGVYQSYMLGDSKLQVKLILLDTRFFRDTLPRGSEKGRRYDINPTGDVLGEAQWKWLEQELTSSKAAVHLIGTSIQFIAEEQGFEKWANFPAARQRMIDLLSRTKPSGVIFMSGDRHIAEVSRLAVPGLKDPVYDFTSSGLTHTWSTVMEESNRHRVGNLVIERNFGVIDMDRRGKRIRVRFTTFGPGLRNLSEYSFEYLQR